MRLGGLLPAGDRPPGNGPTPRGSPGYRILVVLALAGAFLTVQWVLTSGGGFREFIIACLALFAVFLVVAPGQRPLRIGYYLWILTFAIGWRQLYLTQNLQIHPSEVLIWVLFALLVARRLAARRPLPWPVPGAVTVLLVLGWVGLATALTSGLAWDIAVSEFKLFLVIIPVLFVTAEMVCDGAQFRNTLAAIGATLLFISILGVIEYYDPSLTAPFQGFFGQDATFISEQGLTRASFSFWGAPIVSVYLSAALVPMLSAASASRARLVRLYFAVAALTCGLAVYVAGNRGPWVATGLALSAYVSRDWLRRWWLFLAILVPVLLAPAQALDHLLAVFDPQQYYDTSVLKREARFGAALLLIQKSPLLGNGWGAAGWVHSDLAQIAANLGLPALLLFALWYGSRLRRLWAAGRRASANWPGSQNYAHGLFAGLLAALLCLSTEAIIVLPPLIIPLWFLLALADRLCAIIAQSAAAPAAELSTGPSVKSAPAFRPRPYLQQRVDPPKLP